MEIATLGGGCFWCLEAVYDEVQGISSVLSGYEGGEVENPSYQQVCSGSTGHAEVVQITFDPEVITYRDILDIFFAVHDPTTMNRQGADVGTQYRSVVFTHTKGQEEIAEEMIVRLNDGGVYERPIVTEVVPHTEFYPAEDYHQRYFEKNPYQGYCQAVIAPKIAKFRKSYAKKLKV